MSKYGPSFSDDRYRWGSELLRRLVIVAVLLITVAGCGQAASGPSYSGPAPSLVAQAPSPATSPTPCIPCLMTKKGVYGIPLPSDASKVGSAGVLSSKLGTIAQYTAFYANWMPAHGWTIEPAFSWTDPSVGVAKQSGYGTIQTFCVLNSNPIKTVIIDVGSPGGKVDQGKLTEMFVNDDPGESSCP